MSTIYWVYQCAGTRGVATQGVGPAVAPTCNPTGQGGWIQIETQLPAPFDPTKMDTSTLYSAFASGLVVGGIGLTIALSIALVVRFVRKAW